MAAHDEERVVDGHRQADHGDHVGGVDGDGHDPREQQSARQPAHHGQESHAERQRRCHHGAENEEQQNGERTQHERPPAASGRADPVRGPRHRDVIAHYRTLSPAGTAAVHQRDPAAALPAPLASPRRRVAPAVRARPVPRVIFATRCPPCWDRRRPVWRRAPSSAYLFGNPPEQFFREYKQLVLDHARVAGAGGASLPLSTRGRSRAASKSGHFICSRERTDHVLPTRLCPGFEPCYALGPWGSP